MLDGQDDTYWQPYSDVTCQTIDMELDEAIDGGYLHMKVLNKEYRWYNLRIWGSNDGENYDPALAGEKILLQGVVDCAILEEDGITVLDFKTDYVTEQSLMGVTEKYKAQVYAYAQALSRIYQMPIKAAKLYFFHIDQFVDII